MSICWFDAVKNCKIFCVVERKKGETKKNAGRSGTASQGVAKRETPSKSVRLGGVRNKSVISRNFVRDTSAPRRIFPRPKRLRGKRLRRRTDSVPIFEEPREARLLLTPNNWKTRVRRFLQAIPGKRLALRRRIDRTRPNRFSLRRAEIRAALASDNGRTRFLGFL